MPCGERCKQILDGGVAVKKAINCMTNTVLLNSQGEKIPSPELAKKYRDAAEKFALTCAEIEASFN